MSRASVRVIFRVIFRALACLTVAWALAGCGGTRASDDDGGSPPLDGSAPEVDASDEDAPAKPETIDAETDDGTDAGAGAPDAPSADAGGDQTPLAQLGLVVALAPPKVYLLSLDANGTVTQRAAAPAPDAPMALARSTDDRFVYVVGRKIAALSVDRAAAALGAINELDAGLPNWTGLTVDPTRQWLVVSDRMRGLTVLGLSPDGSIVAAPGAGTSAQVAHDVTFDPSGKFTFAASCDQDLVIRHAWDAGQGTLLLPTTPVARAGSGPKRVVFHQSGQTAYVLNVKEQTVTSFDYEGATGTLAAPETVSIGDPAYPPLLGYCDGGHLVVHPSGQLAYATTTTGGGSVTILSVAPSGRLTVVGYEHYVLFRGADPLAIDPTGTFLLVGNTSGSLQVFRIAPGDGHLTHVGGGLSGTSALQFLSSEAG